MDKRSRFEKNCERWSFFCPDIAKKLPLVECFRISKQANPDGSLNLKSVHNKESFLLYSTENISQESMDWFSHLNLNNIEVLYVYGVGLGYYYPAAKKWLEEGFKKRFLVFLEDDLEVLRIFFETEMAEEILKDLQVRVFYVDWNEKEVVFDRIASTFIFQPFKVTGLNSYCTHKEQYAEVNSYIAFYSNLRSGLMSEYIFSGGVFFKNFYRNLLYLPFSRFGNGLFDQFKNIPAIICGAGPSLAKNIEVLKTLQDRALIFAGGTAMNAINAQGVIPHFGVGIDPNVYQYSRLIANQAFEVPFFYRNRMYHEALKMIHGERLYVTGAGGYYLAEWMERQLNIPTGKVLSEGYNVINFSVSIAQFLGCNPVFFAGVDLAYSQNRSYAPGIFSHAIHDPKQDFRTKSTNEELILKDDIEGNPVYTLWKWVHEALWFSDTASKNSESLFLNCTEGGVGFPGIQNMPLQEAAEKYLTRQYDFDGMIHCAIQQAAFPDVVTKEKIVEILKELLTAFKQCLEVFQNVQIKYSEMQQSILLGAEAPKDYFTEDITDTHAPLNENVAYIYILQSFNAKFIEFLAPQLRNIDYEAFQHSSIEDIHQRKIDLIIQRYRFLQQIAKININCIEEVLKIHEDSLAMASVPAESIKGADKSPPKEKRSFMPPEDADAGKDRIGTEAHVEFYSAGGPKKMEQTTLNGKLHGFSIFYHKNGTLLSKTRYLDGKKEGKAWFYYPNGELYSLQCFREGKREGTQEYYYPEGSLKSSIHFNNGILNGDVFLYYPNGKLMRELHFVDGHRHGEERLWSVQGMLLIEAEYDMGRPIRTAREWYENGNLAKEIIYDKDSNRSLYRRWEENGMPWKPEMVSYDDYFDQVTKQSMILNDSFDHIVKSLKVVSTALPADSMGGKAEEIKKDIQDLEEKVKSLHRIGEEMRFESGLDPMNPNEPIWKSDSMRRRMEEHLGIVAKNMGKEIKGMRDLIALTLDILAKKQIPSDDEETHEP